MTTNMWDIFENVKQALDSDGDEGEFIDNSSSDKYKLDNITKEDLKCFSCESENLVYEDGIIVCENCGIDNGAVIDYQQEWRFYGSEDTKHSSDPTRCGMPINPLLPESSMGTIILGKGFEKYRRLNNWNSMTYKERSLLKVFKNIQSKSDDNDISTCVIDRAKIMYKTLSDANIKRGKSRKGLIAACLYNSCKDKNDSRSTKEISQMFNLKIKKMTSGCKQFNEMMYHNDHNYIANIKPTSADDFIERYSTLLKMDHINKKKAIHVSMMATKLGLVSENTPSSIAVGSMYLISQHFKLKITKKRLSELCEISEVTISKTYKKMLPYIKYLLPFDE
jgi:transcription initiation factor TFIIB